LYLLGKGKGDIIPFFVQRATPPFQYIDSTIDIFPQTRFGLILAFDYLNERREDRSFKRIITANECFARMLFCHAREMTFNSV